MAIVSVANHPSGAGAADARLVANPLVDVTPAVVLKPIAPGGAAMSLKTLDQGSSETLVLDTTLETSVCVSDPTATA